MAESTLPKEQTPEAYNKAADSKRKELMKYAGKRRVFGLRSRPKPSDQVYKALSDSAAQLRSKAQKLTAKRVAGRRAAGRR